MAGFHLHHHLLIVAFGALGNLISVCVYVAPLPTFRRIYKEKSTMGFQALPYIIALFSSTLWLYYAFIKRNSLLLVSINSFGCVIETLYIAFFLYYASTKIRRHTLKLIGLVNVALYGMIFVVTFFAFKDHHPLGVQVVGWICVTVSVSVFAAPMSILFQVVRTKSVEFMPFSLSFFLTLSAVMWLAYGLLQKDMCVALPNVLGFVLGVVQMLMYGIYRKSKPAVLTVQEEKLPEHVMNIMVLGTPEVHPLDSSKNFEKHQGSPPQVPVDNKEGAEEEETHAVTLEMEPCRPVKMHLDSPALIVSAA